MKLKITAITMLVFFLCSCGKNFTDLSPISQRNVSAFYQTSGDMITAINSAYKALQMNGTYNQSYWVMFETRSDNTDAGPDQTGLGADLAVIDNFVEVPATAELITSAYLDSYVGIGRCNIVLSRIDPIQMDERLKARIKGEALFLRSLFYYNLTVAFGNIPLILNEISVDEGKGYLQVPAAEVYKQLIADLKQSEEWLWKKSEYAAADAGRATKGSAAALLAKIYLTAGDKTSAVPVLRRIISDYGYILLPEYANIWGVANENNAESIFEVQFKGGGTSTGNAFTNVFSPLLRNSVGAYKNRPMPEMAGLYQAGDKRFAASMRTSYISTTGATIIAPFIVKYGTETKFNEGDADYNFIVLRYADVLLMLAEALGESDEAYNLINDVRFRAGLGKIDASTPGSFSDKLLRERRVELAFENHRWPDLLRFGKAKDIMQAQGKNPRLLFRIPQRELDINPQFKQNDI